MGVDEAGVFFGSPSMSRDFIMRNLSVLNELWSGSLGRDP